MESLVGFDSEWCKCGCGYYLACFTDGHASTFSKDTALTTFNSLSTVATHGGRNDYLVLGAYPAPLKYDSLMLAWLYQEEMAHGLKPLTERYLGYSLEDPIKVREGVTYWRDYKTHIVDAPQDEVLRYCMADAEATKALVPFFWTLLPKPLQDWYLKVEVPFDRALFGKEQRGVRLDLQRLAETDYQVQVEASALKEELFKEVGYEFNLNSPKQVGQVLFTDTWVDTERREDGEYSTGRQKFKTVEVERQGRGLRPPGKTAGGQARTDEETLQQVGPLDPVAGRLLRWRELDKLHGTYLVTFPTFCVAGRLHGRFNSTGTVTGRLSSNSPNLQNIPRRGEYGRLLRSFFVADPGKVLVVGDLDQVEYRLLAYVSRDPELCRVFENGEDIHQTTADLVSVDRDLAKNINFSINYLAKAKTVKEKYAPDQSVAFVQEVLDKHRAQFPAVYEWQERVLTYCRRNEYVVTLGGRIRHLPAINSSNWGLRHRAERQAINAVIQGSVADIMKYMMNHMYSLNIPMLLQVHDEIVCEVPEDQADQCVQVFADSVTHAETQLDIRVPWVVNCTPHVGKDWVSAKG